MPPRVPSLPDRRTLLLALSIPVLVAGLTLAVMATTASPRAILATTDATAISVPDLLRGADAGTVVQVVPALAPVTATSASAGAGATSATGTGTAALAGGAGNGTRVVLGARLSDGKLAPVQSTADPSAVIESLRALGHAPLVSADANQLWPSGGGGPSLLWLVPFVLLGLGALVAAFVANHRTARGAHAAGPQSTESATTPQAPPVSFADVGGVDEAKLELEETVEFLKEPARFLALGARPVRGVLLSGPPGTGKTLLARAVAYEAGVPFFAASGSEFVERYVGVGAERVRALFAKARAAGRAVVFIDEIDAVAKVRGGLNSHDEREQTLNQLLVEMDGFSTTDSVAVIAATNRVDTLDPALLRPGRFTRKIHVPLPDREAREAILRVHAGNKPLAGDVDLPALARRTYGFSGAMLADMLNEAAIFTARGSRDTVTADDVHRGWLKVAVGTARQRSMDERERSIIAAHEAGHAICGALAGDGRRVEEISLFQHGEALGVTVSSAEDDALPSERRLRARLVALMGGRAAEELVFGEVTGGASNDFEQATRLATQMVTRWGLGHDPDAVEPGPTGRGMLSALVHADRETPLPSEVVGAQGRAIRHLLDEAYAGSLELLGGERDRLDRVAAFLFEQERMSGDEFDAVMRGSLAAAGTERWRALVAGAPEVALGPRRSRSPDTITAAAGALTAAAAAGQPGAPAPQAGLRQAPAPNRRGLRDGRVEKRDVPQRALSGLALALRRLTERRPRRLPRWASGGPRPGRTATREAEAGLPEDAL